VRFAPMRDALSMGLLKRVRSASLEQKLSAKAESAATGRESYILVRSDSD
jgi:hypothetical protein